MCEGFYMIMATLYPRSTETKREVTMPRLLTIIKSVIFVTTDAGIVSNCTCVYFVH